MKQEQGGRNLLGRVVDRARVNLHQTDSDEYTKRGTIDSLVLLFSYVAFTIDVLGTGADEADLLWLVPAMGGIMAATRNSDLRGNALEKERQVKLDNAARATK